MGGGGGADPKHGMYVPNPNIAGYSSSSLFSILTYENRYLGPWGALGSQTQRGIITYGRSSNSQKPLGGAAHAAVFNVFRRSKGQILYVVPPLVISYLAMDWAVHRYVFSRSLRGVLGGTFAEEWDGIAHGVMATDSSLFVLH